jgi:TolA-binding protein
MKALLACLCVWWTVGSLGCVSSLEQARRSENAGQSRKALQEYRSLASQRLHPQSVQGQAGVVRMLVKRERWNEVAMAASNLGSFLDSEDEWYQRYANNAPVFQAARKTIATTLVEMGRKTHSLAKRIGSPQAYGAASGLFGAYLRFFPQGPYRAEAAAGKGESLSLRTNCKSALVFFREAIRRLKQANPPGDGPSTSILRKRAKRGLLFCRIKGWMNARQAKTTAGSQQAFAGLLREAQQLLKEAPQEVAKDLMQHARSLRQAGAFPEALQLLLILIRSLPSHPLTMLARQRALQMFGRTKNWAPLLAAIGPLMPQSRAGIARTRFWRRVQTLSVLHGARRAAKLLAARRIRQAELLLLSVSRWSFALKHSRTALYQASLKLEGHKRYRAAAVLYRRLYKSDPSHRVAIMAAYRHARMLERQRYNSMAAAWYEKLARNHPKSIIASRSLYRAWLIYRVQRRKEKRKQLRRWILRGYPRSMEAVRVRKRR